MEDISHENRMKIQQPNLIQLYSASTPNGMKVSTMLEEIVDLRRTTDQFDYEAHTIDLRSAESRRQDFKNLNPNGKIPVIVDPRGPDGNSITVFESGAILMYLADKFDVLLPPIGTNLRYETLKWFMWASTSLSSQFKLFGFYFKYCKHKLDYCIARYEKECKRLLGVLENQLKSHNHHWIVGDAYTIADICAWPWIYALRENYDDAMRDVFYNFSEFPHVREWYHRCLARPASQRSLEVNVLKF
jgi:GST-like protein